jgi:hypothetical protein
MFCNLPAVLNSSRDVRIAGNHNSGSVSSLYWDMASLYSPYAVLGGSKAGVATVWIVDSATAPMSVVLEYKVTGYSDVLWIGESPSSGTGNKAEYYVVLKKAGSPLTVECLDLNW